MVLSKYFFFKIRPNIGPFCIAPYKVNAFNLLKIKIVTKSETMRLRMSTFAIVKLEER